MSSKLNTPQNLHNFVSSRDAIDICNYRNNTTTLINLHLIYSTFFRLFDLIDHNVTKEIMTSAWQHKWQEQREASRGLQNLGTAWMTEWSVCRKKLYKGLERHEATALFLLRSQVLGVREWLYRIGVPNVTPECPCRWHAQTVQHLLIHCPRMPTATLRQRVESGDIHIMLNTPGKAQITARWFIGTGLLSQFEVARQIDDENPQSYGQLTPW